MNEDKRKGFFISFEGNDGAGKSTQIGLLKSYLESKGHKVIITREPGGTKISEDIRKIILDKENAEMCDMTEALLYAASRAQHVHQVIKPALSEGKIVICDRFVDSSIAYQGYGRKLGDSVRAVNDFAIEGCMPDLTVLLKLSPDIGSKRIEDAAKDKDRLETEDIKFHRDVFAGYEALEKAFPDRIKGIDANRDIESINKDIISCVNKVLAV